MIKKKTPTQAWTEIEAVLEETIDLNTRMAWQHVIRAYIEGTFFLDDVVDTLREVRKVSSLLPTSKALSEPPEPASHGKGITRTQVLAEIVAAHATRDAEVKQFREEVLGETLLQPHEIQSWITQEREKEQELPTVFLNAVPLPVGHDIRAVTPRGFVPEPPLAIGEQHPAGEYRVETLAYGTPGSAWVKRVPIGHGGILARLHHLSTTLAQRYSWQPAQATAFILTGLPPVLRTIAATWGDRSFFQTQTSSVTALNRLVLTIDPTLSPKEVHNYFQWIRQHILGAKWRDLKEKQLQLAQAALHCSNEDPWTQRMESWNTEFPDWCYDNLSNFKRDCQNAIEKLLAPPIHNPFLPTQRGQ